MTSADVTEIAELELSNTFFQLSVSNGVEIVFNETKTPFLEYAFEMMSGNLTAAAQGLTLFDATKPLNIVVSRKSKVKFCKKLTLPGCTKNEILSNVNYVENRILDYVVDFKFGNGVLDGMSKELISNCFKNIKFTNSSDNSTAAAQITAKLRLSYVIASGVNVNSTTLQDCDQKFNTSVEEIDNPCLN